MPRIQVTLDPVDHRRATLRAADLGMSFAEYTRRLIRADLATAIGTTDVRLLFALGNSGGSDIATHKDRYLAEAVEAEQRRTRVK
jgi:hypothetical protein